MTDFAFQQVDVFASAPLKGNPLAVVVGADGLTDGEMAAFANWTNLSETTFLLKPRVPQADYRVRIFTPRRELPFAGHPTLGSCHVWLSSGGVPHDGDVLQECGAGLVRIRRAGGRLAFAAPPTLRSGPIERDVLVRVAAGLQIAAEAILASAWVDNGPGWLAVMLSSRAEVLALKPDYRTLTGLRVGVVGPWVPETDGPDAQFELRAFVSGEGGYEDPVTGSLNASVAQWLMGQGAAPSSYVARQGTALGRAGSVYVERDGADIWVGGVTTTRIAGKLTL